MPARKTPNPARLGNLPTTLVRLPPDLCAALDTGMAAQPDPKPLKAEAIRYALRD